MSQFHAALFGHVLIIDHEHIIALLVGKDRGARNCQHLERFDSLKQDGNKLLVRQFVELVLLDCLNHRIGDCAAQDEGVGILGNADIDEVELAGLAVYFPIGQAHANLDGMIAALVGIAFPKFKNAAHRDRKDHVHGIRADNRRQRTAGRADNVTDRDRCSGQCGRRLATLFRCNPD